MNFANASKCGEHNTCYYTVALNCATWTVSAADVERSMFIYCRPLAIARAGGGRRAAVSRSRAHYVTETLSVQKARSHKRICTPRRVLSRAARPLITNAPLASAVGSPSAIGWVHIGVSGSRLVC
ncbi:hypothetical protein EVAR_68551_1 [Eumeta japonica]|uniref:Uncharacterized protein n=1 Tax=Eumeta variegata TaxID=151549 RepID=A0A4C1ZYT3_EUMVA|nr:hypothetical protein EVAR_68551_1 [Eumeta japonica]